MAEPTWTRLRRRGMIRCGEVQRCDLRRFEIATFNSEAMTTRQTMKRNAKTQDEATSFVFFQNLLTRPPTREVWTKFSESVRVHSEWAKKLVYSRVNSWVTTRLLNSNGFKSEPVSLIALQRWYLNNLKPIPIKFFGNIMPSLSDTSWT